MCKATSSSPSFNSQKYCNTIRLNTLIAYVTAVRVNYPLLTKLIVIENDKMFADSKPPEIDIAFVQPCLQCEV